ncbi:hypothetical protein ACFQ5N_10620 [Lutibacter holmesii]|uniref:MFS transporter n=1 Tax=Lutibacter holmesii TaxID=1137985 RepID=A0ABW3WPF6_9FLAO
MSISQESKNFIKSLQIIHIFLLIGVLGFSGYVSYTLKEELFFSYQEDKAFLFLAIIIAYIGNLSSKFIYAKLLNKIPEKASLPKKGAKFSTAHIFRMALLEFPALLCVIFVLYTNNSFYFILVGILVFLMLVSFPTKSSFEKDIPLTIMEKSMLEKL